MDDLNKIKKLYKNNNNIINYINNDGTNILFNLPFDCFEWLILNTNIDINYINPQTNESVYDFYNNDFYYNDNNENNYILLLLNNGVIHNNKKYSVKNNICPPFNRYETNIFFEFCQKGNFGKALKLNADINSENYYLTTIFTWACYFNKIDLCFKLLNMGFKSLFLKDINNNIAIDYLDKNIDVEDLMNLYFKTNFLRIEDQNSLNKIYQESEFKNKYVIKDNVIEAGGYGEIIYIIDKKTQDVKILKKYLKCTLSRLETTYTEILILNKIKNTSIVKFEGIYRYDTCYYLILEKLEFDLLYYFYRLKNYITDKNVLKTKYINILLEIILKLNELHKMGFAHNDFKFDNIMINKYGDIKIVDFGLSYFIGINPICEIIKDYISTYYIEAFDKINLKHKYIDINNKIVKFNINRPTYNTDIYSIGQDFMNLFMNTSNKKYLIYNNDIYIFQKKDNKILNIVDKVNKTSFLKDSYIFDLMAGMIEINSINRLNCIDILSNNIKKKDYTILKPENQNNYVNYSNYEIENLLFELPYLEDIHNNYKGDTLQKSNNIDTSYLAYFNKLCKVSNVLDNFDFIINCLYLIKQLYNKTKEKKELIYYCFYISCIQFNIYFNTSEINTDFLYSLLSDLKYFDIKPIMIHLEYYNIKIKKIDKSKIFDLFLKNFLVTENDIIIYDEIVNISNSY